MKLKVMLFFYVLVKVIAVKSECDSYLECLGSFFDNFFLGHTNFNLTKVRDIFVPGFHDVNLEKENLQNVLSGVSSFLGEELESGVSFETPTNIFQNVNNNTAIYVKTIKINDNIDDINAEEIPLDSNATRETIESINSSNTDTIDFIKPYVNLNISKIVPINNINVVNHTTINLIDDKLIKNIDENEISDIDDYGIYYENNDNSTDYPVIDYIDLYKDTTNEYVDIKTTPIPDNFNNNNYGTETILDVKNTIIRENNRNNSSNMEDNVTETLDKILFPWVAAIYVKKDTSNQFDYYCDGALVSAGAILTAARCIQNGNMQAKPEELLVILGKTSLNSMNKYERFVKVKDVILHDNYTMDGFENDIAILVMEDPVVFSERIQPACLGIEDYKESITTGWAATGDLTLIHLNTDESVNCNDIGGNRTYCAVYDRDIKVCPSYGGLHVTRHEDTWHLHGIRHADPSDRGLCVDNVITFTDLTDYINWIKQYIE
ncbi:coagulation factor X-like isoform X1 [Vanessa tameamea]|uniref:Coagulation factor X-like isoform X1 n=1 Tax=Vanessa tameamea TaxID=334116 RepID=A0ABM4ATY0_VANTA